MKRTIEMEDNMLELIEDTTKDVISAFDNAGIKPNEYSEGCDMIDALDYDGRYHEIIDGAVPVYNYDIKCLWFLYDDEFEEAYDNAGIGDNPRDNNGMSAIYFYIDQQVREEIESWYNDLDECFNCGDKIANKDSKDNKHNVYCDDCFEDLETCDNCGEKIVSNEKELEIDDEPYCESCYFDKKAEETEA